jgi:hypothetical protein
MQQLLPTHDLLDVVEFVKCFEGSEVVDIEAEDFIADLA